MHTLQPVESDRSHQAASGEKRVDYRDGASRTIVVRKRSRDDRELLAFDLSIAAVSALLDVGELTPKPALVDRRENGAQDDLDLTGLRRSARALEDGFASIARAAVDEALSLRLREQLGYIGRDMERRVLVATGGSTAHRGATWALGLLIAGTAALCGSDRDAADVAAAAAILARLPDRWAPYPLSHGARARFVFGAGGARGEARAAFPHVIHVGLPRLRAARTRGLSEECAQLDTLMAIMASLDDTSLLHRGGRVALNVAKSGARAVLTAGGSATLTGLQRLYRLDDQLTELGVSPRGSAALLSVTLFLDRLSEAATNHRATHLA
jgi:triphosphoribosyl-dephospho-CoA synthase